MKFFYLQRIYRSFSHYQFTEELQDDDRGFPYIHPMEPIPRRKEPLVNFLITPWVREPLVSVEDCPSSKISWRAFDCWFEEFGFDQSVGVGNSLEVLFYPHLRKGVWLSWSARYREVSSRVWSSEEQEQWEWAVRISAVSTCPFQIQSILGVGKSLPQNHALKITASYFCLFLGIVNFILFNTLVELIDCLQKTRSSRSEWAKGPTLIWRNGL